MYMKKKLIYVGSTMLFFIILTVLSITCYHLFTNEENETPLFEETTFPKVDASLATQPLMDAFYADFTSTKPENVNINYTNTHPGYIRLIDGEVDLIIVTEPSEEELAYAKEKNVELEVIPVVNEAFVFFINKNNPVENLTLEEIQKIYSGKITNWKSVGGENAEIMAYQRPKNSGSQTGMLSLVMKDIKLKEPIKDEMIETMAGIIKYVAEYKDSARSIGYSYYYYATTMYGNENIKFVGINNIKPTYEAIQNHTYPIMSAYYIVMRKDTPKDSPTRKLADAMLSTRGQLVAKDAGYVPIK